MALRRADSLVNTAHFPIINLIIVLSSVAMRGSPAAKDSGLRGGSHRRHITTTMRTKRDKDLGQTGPRSRTGGAADDDDSSCFFWGDAGFDA
jgi:hypothetical protein